ncbi:MULTISPECIES: dTDP-4-dehydrorhamnose reductase [unclassified Corynebacterium]|uniref:dTDP-4-dehydrorhamnose reductase n=1 Tax=unclassified Corynebacterium TaxID=2624378 RepID=UPI0029CA1EDF|nr:MULTISPECIES: dTDP-4-dehydrorhamnose reductase [unclassified Corynebacterium]WPF66629.1 dTDP-4-dehydrorhamnose reductase [Corynebacterium sp. 22KM0430]WPF69117.1 dTDP-4-dehydrorhamnose reductase [Corynebacterium sp. 21KM1197]
MKVVVTGAAGQLGRCLRLSAPRTARVTWCDRGLLDVTDPRQVADSPLLSGADVVINTAAFTAVDAAEEQREAATALNALAPEYLARRCVREGAHLVHVSTDYVFGAARAGRALIPADPVCPTSVYGSTKAAGEAAIDAVATANPQWRGYTVARTAWLFSGRLLPEHRDFVSTMLRLAQEGVNPRVVSDQTGSPTFALDLARALWEVVGATPAGIVHLAGSGRATWYDLARATFELAGHDPERVRPVSTAEYPTAARRPEWSVLASQKELPEWRDGVARALAATLLAP